MDPSEDLRLRAAIEATERLRRENSMADYSHLRNEREKATFAMMMRMSPEALTEVRKEFFVREDAIKLDEFIYIINKHLINKKGDSSFVMETAEQREFGTNMYELFKDIDVNGDGDLEWQEFTTFTVEKANLLNKRQKMASIAHYHDSTDSLDLSSQYRHRHDISRFVNIPPLCQFAMLEDHKNSIYLFNARHGRHLKTITTDAAPTAVEHVNEKDKDILVTALADMTLATYSLTDPNPNKRYQHLSTWATPGVQIALAYQPESKLLYSGGVNYNIYSWNISERNLVSTLSGHSDIVMSLINLKKLNNIASASLDKTVCVWDSYTNERILHLHGHKKGVFDLTYSLDYRLLFSCGFEHDACVWSPFVNSLVFRLKGHHASLVGCHAIEGTPEIITGDTSGVFKLWDVRNFQCVQTFVTNASGQETKDNTKMTSFFHTKLPSRNALQKEDDSRIYAASKLIFSFDQARVVHEATTDKSNVIWVSWNEGTCNLMTTSDRNVIIWDGLMGSTTVTNPNICGEEISACCLDDRKRKIIIGDVHGRMGVYNPSNGALMKEVIHDVEAAVVSLEYVNKYRTFVAGFANGLVKIFDENSMEDCHVIRTFEAFNMHPELLTLIYHPLDYTVATAGASSGVARMWNYNSGKCELELNVCVSITDHVVFIAFLHPYPLIVTSDSVGNIAIWGSSGSKFPGFRLAGFKNQTVVHAFEEPTPANGDDSSPKRLLAPVVTEIATSTGDGEDGAKSDDDTISQVSNPTTNKSAIRSKSKKKVNTKHREMAELSKFTVESMKKAEQEFKESEKKWGTAVSAQGITWDPERFLLFIGDDMGVLRCYDIRDMMKDIHYDTMLLETPDGLAINAHAKSTTKGICMRLPRTAKSALAPVHSTFVRYLVGSVDDAYVYQGIKFVWALQAHEDRIMTCTPTPRGILTSAADRLVKMWTFSGSFIGVLKKSVPVGKKSQSWNLDIDVTAIIAKENKELDEIIESVGQLAQSEDLPDIENQDFSGMEPGAHAADFSRSELRLRIDKTSSILGLNFPKAEDYGSDNDDDNDDSSKSISRNYIDADLRSTTSKSLDAALKELKSVASSVNYAEKTRKMTMLQKKRRHVKLDMVSTKYEKHGMKIVPGVSSLQQSGTMSAEEVEELDHLISMSSDNHSRNQNDANANSDLYSVSSSSVLSDPMPGGTYTPSHRPSTLAESVRNFAARGKRTIALNQSCLKYGAYTELDRALTVTNNRTETGALSQEERNKLKAYREEKARRQTLQTAAMASLGNTSKSFLSATSANSHSYGDGAASISEADTNLEPTVVDADDTVHLTV